MYRMQLQAREKMEDQNQALTRVASYPVVHDTLEKLSGMYQKNKEGSTAFRLCGNLAEASASLAYKASQPVLRQLPVAAVNDYAVSKLAELESSYPVIVQSTQEVTKAVQEYSKEKFDDCKLYTADKFNNLADLAHFNAVLDITNCAVDRFLPEIANEKDDIAEDEALLVPNEALPTQATDKIQVLSAKVRQRAYNHAMSRVKVLEKRSQEAVGKLTHTINLIEYARENLSNISLSDCTKKMEAVYDEITREGEGEVLDADAGFEKRTIFVARSLALRARSSMRTVSLLSFSLQKNLKLKIDNARDYAESLYTTLNNTSSFKEFSAELITELRQKLSFLEDFASTLVNVLSQSPPLSWLTSKMKSLPPTEFESDDDDSDSDSDDDEEERNSELSEQEDGGSLNTTHDDTLNSTDYADVD